jgi:hypothetical protein
VCCFLCFVLCVCVLCLLVVQLPPGKTPFEAKVINNKSFCRLCGLMVRVPGYGSRGPGSIPGANRFSER